MAAILSKWNVGNIILASGWVGRIIICILFIISVVLLAIFIKKVCEFRKIEKENRNFLDQFYAKSSLEEFNKMTPTLRGPLLKVFKGMFEELKKSEGNPGIPSTKLLSNISSSIAQIKAKEIHNFESYLVFVATAVTISPFLGLLGTVWGIMTAFMDIRTYGSAHINIVAPGIAEALITTAVGLCVAIPAVIFYNYLSNRASKLTEQLNLFSNRLIEEVKLTFPK